METEADISLGGSGSGKTTLLNAVAHRLNDLPVKAGKVAFVPSHGGAPLGKHEAKRRIGFVRQQDFLVDCLTGKCRRRVVAYFDC